MKFKTPAQFRSLEEFTARLQEIDPALGSDEKLLGADGPLGQSITVEGHTLKNRFAIHPMEGWDATHDGAPTEQTLRRWHRFGLSGADMIWGGEAFAVHPDGRANPNQLFLNQSADVAGRLEQLLNELKAGRAEMGADASSMFTGLQLTHSGRFSRPDSSGQSPKVAFRHPVLDDRFGVKPDQEPLTDGELEGIGELYVASAKIAQEVGFNFVDVKSCHGYLLHEMLSARSRPGPYGGSFENRSRLFARIVKAIRTECPGLAIGVRISIDDVFPFSKDENGVGIPKGMDDLLPYTYGFGVDQNNPIAPDYDEPFQFLQLVESLGIEIVNISRGTPYYTPHLGRPAAYPPSDGYLAPRDPLFEVVGHINAVRACKQAVPNLLYVASGYSYLQDFLPNVAQYEIGNNHADFVGLGRMVLSYPEFPADILAGRPMKRKLICRTFSDCTTAPRNKIISGCYPLDPYYKEMPQAVEVRALRPKRD